VVDQWAYQRGMQLHFITPGKPTENGYCGSFNGKLRGECLNGEIFHSVKERQIVIEHWRVEYNTRHLHSALGYRPPVPAAYSPLVSARPVSQPRDAPRSLHYEWYRRRGQVSDTLSMVRCRFCTTHTCGQTGSDCSR
jgi:hypothetical protein